MTRGVARHIISAIENSARHGRAIALCYARDASRKKDASATRYHVVTAMFDTQQRVQARAFMLAKMMLR